MREWARICCAIDFEEPSTSALQAAISLSRKLGSDLTLLHVNEAGIALSGGDLGDAGTTAPELLALARREIEPKLAGARRAALLGTGKPVEAKVAEGRAADEIVRFVRERAVDLLVVGTHGRRGVGRLLRGSVAEEVARRVECPVLMVGRSGPEHGGRGVP